jgi:hypothetical protein
MAPDDVSTERAAPLSRCLHRPPAFSSPHNLLIAKNHHLNHHTW